VHQVARQLGELDVGTDEHARCERSELRDQQLVPTPNSEGVFLRRQVDLVLELEAAVRMRDVSRVAQRPVLGDAVVATPDDHDAVRSREADQAVGDRLGVSRQDVPVVGGDAGGGHVVVVDRPEEAGAGQFREEQDLRALRDGLLDRLARVGQEGLDGRLGP
jgi:hypothetical protein